MRRIKIAVTSTGQGLDAQSSSVFGRCPYFVLVEVKEAEIASSQAIQNPAQNQRGGAGIAAAQTVGDQGAEAVITGAVGPNAFGVLQRLEIDVYQAEQASVKQNVEKFLEGSLQEITGATGGPGMGRGGGRGQGPGRGQGRGRQS